MTVHRAYVTTSFGQLHYRYAGSTGRPVILLLHQTPSTSEMYEDLMRALASEYRLLAPDTPGMGLSDSAGEPMSIAACTDGIAEALDELGVDQCHVFGHHTGAAIAAELAARYGRIVATLALSGPTWLSDNLKKQLPVIATLPEPTDDGSHLLTTWNRFAGKDDAPLSIVLRETVFALRIGHRYRDAYQAVIDHDFASALDQIDCPALVFAGTEDLLGYAVAPTVARLKNASTASVEGARSYICETHCDEVADLLRRFYTQEKFRVRPVIIAGAGPSGSTLALYLAKHDVPVVLLEQAATLPVDLRASTFHPVSLDLLDELDHALVEQMLQKGLLVDRYQYRDRQSGETATFDMSLIADATAHPFRLQLEQYELTQLNCERLLAFDNAQVEFSRRVTAYRDHGDRVTVTVDVDGTEHTLDGAFVIGADGARSCIRKAAGIDYLGFTYDEKFLVVSTSFPFEEVFDDFSYVNYVADPDEWCVVLRTDKRWRVLFPTTPDNEDDEALLLSDDFIQERLAPSLRQRRRLRHLAPQSLFRQSACRGVLLLRSYGVGGRRLSHQQPAGRHGHERWTARRVLSRREVAAHLSPWCGPSCRIRPL